MSGLIRTLGERCRIGLLALMMARCSAAPAAQSEAKIPTAPVASTTSALDSKDAVTPLHLWEAGPAVKDAPRTTTRPYVPRP